MKVRLLTIFLFTYSSSSYVTKINIYISDKMFCRLVKMTAKLHVVHVSYAFSECLRIVPLTFSTMNRMTNDFYIL